MIRTDKRLRICTALLICNIAFIWGNSLMPAEISQAFSDWVKALLTSLLSGGSSGSSEGGSGVLRKIAHFTEFSALGFLLSWRFGMLKKGWRPAFVCGAVSACIDETIQIFVPNRGPGIKDVLLDCSGVLTGMLILYLGHTYCKKKFTNHPSEESK